MSYQRHFQVQKTVQSGGNACRRTQNMGVSDVYFDEKYCYVYAKYPQIQRKQIIHAMQTVHACQKLQV